MATILTKKSDTASAVPLAGDLTNSTGGAELAVNTADKRLFTKTSGGTVVEVGTNPTILNVDNIQINGNAITSTDTNGNIDLTPNGTGEVNITKVDIDSGAIDGTAIGASSASTGAFTTLSASSTVTLSGGTANGVLYLNGSKVATSGSALTFDGTDFVLASGGLFDIDSTNAAVAMRIRQTTVGAGTEFNTTVTENTGVTFDSSDSGGVTARSFIWTAGGSEQMRLTSTGLGIGTSSPGEKLTVSGNIHADGSGSGSGTYGPYVQIGRTNGPKINATQEGADNDIQGLAFFTKNSTVTADAPTERMRLDAPGNLGLGVTPSAWGSNYRAVEVSGAVNVFGNTGDANFAGIGANLYHNNTNYLYRYSTFATMYLQDNGTHQWHTAPSGTAGNAITFTQALTLDANRNLLLNGTTAPASGVGTFAIFNGTAPTGSVTNGIVLYAEDVSSSSELKVRDEAGNVTTLSPHNFSMIPEGPSEDMAWAYYSERDGKRINIDMLKAIRLLEKLSGEKLVYES